MATSNCTAISTSNIPNHTIVVVEAGPGLRLAVKVVAEPQLEGWQRARQLRQSQQGRGQAHSVATFVRAHGECGDLCGTYSC